MTWPNLSFEGRTPYHMESETLSSHFGALGQPLEILQENKGGDLYNLGEEKVLLSVASRPNKKT